MYKLVLILGIVVLLILFVWSDTNPHVKPPTPIPVNLTASPAILPLPSPIIIKLDNNRYSVYSQLITNMEKLVLIPNFTQKKSSQLLFEENECNYGANGGFYTEEYTPLGIFKTDNQIFVSSIHPNKLFNGFVYKTNSNQLEIDSTLPALNSLAFVFQSGPIFNPESELQLTTDEPARRIILGKTSDRKFYFLAITEAENIFNGPYLELLPKIAGLYNSKLTSRIQQLVTLINLDGGSASAFYSDKGTAIGELTPIGSFICGF